MEERTLGLVAGGGRFPLLCAKAAKRHGRRVIAVAHKGETDPLIEREVDELHWIQLGQLGKLIKIFQKNRVGEVLFAGTITKKRIFRDIWPDLRALSLWKRLESRHDDEILRGVASELESEGLKVLHSTAFLSGIVAPSGVLSAKKPSSSEWEDIRLGWRLAKEVGRLDIGQCLVLKERTVLAVEAIDGTDQTILRGGRLGGPGVVVVKVCKPHQDTRFDLPSVGRTTIETMAEVKASVLALEAGKSLLFDREDTLKAADSHGISIVGVDGGAGR